MTHRDHNTPTQPTRTPRHSSFYGEGVQPMPPVGTGFKCYVLSKNHRTRKRRLDHRRRSLLPAKKSLIGGACTVGRRLYGRAVCTPDNFLQCNKPMYVWCRHSCSFCFRASMFLNHPPPHVFLASVKPKLPICCNGVFHARTFSPSCGAVGKWYLSPVGADCNSVCRDNNLVCTNEVRAPILLQSCYNPVTKRSYQC